MRLRLAGLLGLASLTLAASPASAQDANDPYMGQLMITGANFCPVGYVSPRGHSVGITDNPALYSLIGTNFGPGTYRSFVLPDLRGRTLPGFGTGPGLERIVAWQAGGSQRQLIEDYNYPTHSHRLFASLDGPDAPSPAGHAIPTHSGGLAFFTPNPPIPALALARDVIRPSGRVEPQYIDLHQPSLGMTVCLATAGHYPPRE